MRTTYRPNLKFSEVRTCQAGMASPTAIDALATALTLAAVALVIAVVVLLEHLSEFWAGVVIGGLGGVTVIVGLLVVGACLGGARLSETPRPSTCDRGMHR
jgi:hypothetical protein